MAMKSAAVALLALLIAACGQISAASPSGTTPTPSKVAIKGEITAPTCYRGYNLVGASVQIRDEKNELIGTGSTSAAMNSARCVASFEVDVPTSAKFYQVTVGSHTGPPYSQEKLQSQDWHMAMSMD